MTQTADAVVIGAGIIGAACAYRLAERGLRVIVLEQGATPANGSTGKSAAGVRAQFGSTTNIVLSKSSIEEYAAMESGGYQPIGYLMIVPPGAWPAHLAGVDLQRSLGVGVEVLTPDEAQRHVRFDTEGVNGATFCPTDGAVDPHGITLHYVRRARELDVAVRLNTAFHAARHTGATWRVSTSDGVIDTPIVVNAAGCWSGEVAAAAGLEVPVRAARRNVYASAPDTSLRGLPMTFDLASGVWFRSEGERVILGRANPDDTGWCDGTIDWDWFEPTMVAATERFPWLETMPLDAKASWWGYYEITPDHFPIIGTMPGTTGWLNACGFSGHGVMQAAAVGRVIAAEATGDEPFVDITSLRIERFSDSSHVQRDIHL